MSSAYHGRRAPNVSQYLHNLNTLPSVPELAGNSDIHLNEGDLDFLTHAEFFDFDSFNPGGNVDAHHAHARHAEQKGHRLPVNSESRLGIHRISPHTIY